jgi:hypothetical protein
VTARNTVVIPVKTTAGGAYRLEGRNGATGAIVWSAATDYVTPPHNWLPPYNVLLTPQGRLYPPPPAAGCWCATMPTQPPARWWRRRSFGAAAYNANPAAFDGSVFVNTPLTADAQGNVFFGFQVTGRTPRGCSAGSRASPPTARAPGLARRRRPRPGDPEACDELRAGALERRRHALHRGEHRLTPA